MSDLTPPIDGMTAPLTPSGGGVADAALTVVNTVAGQMATTAVAVPEAERKGLDLALIKCGSKDFLDFLDATKEVFFAYLYHRTGSTKMAHTLLGEVYHDTLSRAMSLWWFGSLSLKLLLDSADRALQGMANEEADLDRVYLPTLNWLSPEGRTSMGSMHDALWTLPQGAQRLLIFSMLIGFPDERLAQVFSLTPEALTEQLKVAKDLLLQRWQPVAEVAGQLQSLVFAPSLDIAAETSLRMGVVEKYNAFRWRKYQWVIIAGLFAVMSNVIVASVLAFAVVMQPPTSLRGTRSEVASLDAVVLQRQMDLDDAKRSLSTSFKEAQRVAAYGATRDFTSLGLATALESLKAQQSQEAQVNKLLKLMQRAKTADTSTDPIRQIAMTIDVPTAQRKEGE